MKSSNEVSSSSATRPRPNRILFVSLWELGWKTWARQLEHYSAGHEGIEAVHLRVEQTRWMWALSRQLPVIHRQLVSAKRLWEWYMKREVLPRLQQERFDAVMVSSQILAPALIEPCRLAGIPFAVAMDVTGPAYQRDLLNRQIPADEKWADECRIYNAAALCVPMSSWIAKSLQSDFRVPDERIQITPPSIATAPFQKSQPSVNSKGALPRIFFCGNDWERKGGPRLLKWHQELWTQKAELHIVSGGAPPLGNLPNVVCHGTVPHEVVLNELLPSSDIFCLPTQNDMSPFAITEAQAAGLPTVSSKVGGLSDLVLDGTTGFLIERNDDAGYQRAIERLLDSASLRQQMSQAARQHAGQQLDADKVFPLLLDRLVALKTSSAALK